MLKKSAVVCGLLLAATAAVADPWPWEPLDDTPYPVGQGAHITYGVTPGGNGGAIWGVFPVQGTDSTNVAYFFPLSTDWEYPDIGYWHHLNVQVPSHHALAYTGLTFQWGDALYVIGADTTDPYAPPNGCLYWYSLDDEDWYAHDIDEEDEDGLGHGLVLGPGCCIAYAPNPAYSSASQIDGWIYCLSGANGVEGSMQFWRYSIEPSSYIAVGGIFPPDSSVIPDQTPKFQWNPSSAGQYRLQVSTDEFFSTTVIDEVVFAPEYQTASKLVNATYYWRVGIPNGGGWLWGSTPDLGCPRFDGHL